MNYKKKVLVISPGLPYPPIDGHKLKIYNLLKILQIDYDVDLVVVTNETLNAEAEAFLKETCKEYSIFHFSKLSFFFNLIKALLNPKLPFQVAYYTFNKVKKHLKTKLHPDYIFFNLIRTVGYIELFDKNKIVLDLVDSIGINYLRSRKNAESIIYRKIYNLEAYRLIRFEKKIVSNVKISLFVNKSEAEYYSRYGEVIWLPNGINKDLLNINYVNKKYKNVICFFGAMFYQPNIDAALWFIKNVLPKLNKEIDFYIVGQNPSKKLIAASHENSNVFVTGFLENPYEIIKSALCTVAPMQTGGGIQNKILESMGLGQITITNKLGADPIIGATNKQNILIANTGIDMAQLINNVYDNTQLYSKIGENARLLIKDNYSWESYKKRLKAVLEADIT